MIIYLYNPFEQSYFAQLIVKLLTFVAFSPRRCYNFLSI